MGRHLLAAIIAHEGNKQSYCFLSLNAYVYVYVYVNVHMYIIYIQCTLYSVCSVQCT